MRKTCQSIFSDVPNPVLVNQLTKLRILRKARADKNHLVESKEETFSHRTRELPDGAEAGPGNSDQLVIWKLQNSVLYVEGSLLECRHAMRLVRRHSDTKGFLT